jgi:TRAP-type C4-dicarboxylate transport system substrate-binding protein
VKLATLAPSGSVWHEILLDMGEQWSDATGGAVTLRIYPGGVAGEEADVLRKMRIGQLHAGSLSLAGLQRITPWVNVLAIPMLMETPEDLIRVRTAMEPRLEAVFRDNGYVLLNWGDVGWMRFFLPEPDASVDACRRLKFMAWSDDAMLDLWRDEGFQNVVLNLSDVLPGLQTGMVNAIGSTPLWVISNQWFPFVPYMVDMPWAPLAGATVIDRRVWERIPAEHRPVLMRIARETGRRFQEETQRKEAEAIAAMQERGLTVIHPGPEVVAGWRALFRSAYPKLRGQLIPADWFDEAVRAAEGGAGGGGDGGLDHER